MHAVADVARGDRTRDTDGRLDAAGAWPARAFRRRDPGFGLIGDAGSRPHDAGAGALLGRQPGWAVRQSATQGLLLRPGPYLDRSRDMDCGNWRAQPGQAAWARAVARYGRQPAR